MDQISNIEPWLNRFTPSRLSVCAETILERIKEAQKANNLIVVAALEERLMRLTYGVERAECQVACALIFFEMNDPTRAFELLNQARLGFTDDDHRQAVVFWMMGIVLLQIPSRQEDVITWWTNAINLFRSIQETRFHPTKRQDPLWHGEQIPRMEETLRNQIKSEEI